MVSHAVVEENAGRPVVFGGFYICLDRAAAKGTGLLDVFLHFAKEIIFPQYAQHETGKAVVIAAILRNFDINSLRPCDARHLCTRCFCHVHAVQIARSKGVCNGGRGHNVPRLVHAFINEFRRENGKIVKLPKCWNPLQFENIFVFFGKAGLCCHFLPPSFEFFKKVHSGLLPPIVQQGGDFPLECVLHRVEAVDVGRAIVQAFVLRRVFA